MRARFGPKCDAGANHEGGWDPGRASHHVQEQRPYDYYSAVTGFLNQQHP
ncbi:hypothetical protein ABZV91_08410 [Nocardia sp. NPDC004568]